MANYHIVKNPEGGWDAKKENSNRVSGHAETQKDAIQLAKQYSGNSGGGEVRIHSPKGPIRDSDTVFPGNDPCPPKDKKF